MRIHLVLLHGADAVHGIENDDPCVVNVLEAFERRLAGIAGGGYQNDRFFAVVCLFEGFCQKVRKDLQSHILEGAGGTVPQLEDIQLGFAEFGISHGRRVLAAELCGGVRLLDAIVYFSLGKISQKVRKDLLSPSLVIHFEERLENLVVIFRELLRNKQSAVL